MEIQTLQLRDPQYPAAVRELLAPPPTIYFRGDLLAVLNRPTLGVVGSRKPTAYGIAITRAFTASAAQHGFTIVSGLAYGVDSLAHQAALDAGGLTLAILGSGPDIISPRAKQRLADGILQSGGSIASHYPPGTGAQRYTFIARNHLIAALSDYLLIPEATISSGSRHTAEVTSHLNKPVLAVPGSINSPLSAGPNQHIRDGALAVTSPAELLTAIGASDNFSKNSQTSLVDVRPSTESAIISALNSSDLTLYQLQQRLDLPLKNLQISLTNLEVSGAIIRKSGGIWSSNIKT